MDRVRQGQPQRTKNQTISKYFARPMDKRQGTQLNNQNHPENVAFENE